VDSFPLTLAEDDVLLRTVALLVLLLSDVEEPRLCA
jgi:hypothetical protein